MSLERNRLTAALPAYEIGQEIGRGAFGVVVAGRHRQLRREVAIKELPSAFGADPDLRSRFVSEAQTLASLDHPHIVPIYDYLEHDGLCLLVMERLSGGTVWDKAQGGGISPQEACGLILATCAGLQAAHDIGVLHRDIKPENLMLSGHGVLKVTDFGIAKLLTQENSSATRTGLIVGTPSYMSPEQAQGRGLSPATDVYATATVLFELLAGRLPYPPDTDAITVLLRRLNEDAPPLATVAETVPAAICAVVDRGLARDRDARYQTAEEFGLELARAATSVWGPGWPTRAGVAVRADDAILVALTGESPAIPTAPVDEGAVSTIIRHAVAESGAAPASAAVAESGAAPASELLGAAPSPAPPGPPSSGAGPQPASRAAPVEVFGVTQAPAGLAGPQPPVAAAPAEPGRQPRPRRWPRLVMTAALFLVSMGGGFAVVVLLRG